MPGEILTDHTAGGEIDRVPGVHRIAAVAPRQAHERALPSAWKNRPSSKRRGVPGCSSDGQGQRRPSAGRSSLGNAVIVGKSAAGRQMQLLENFARLSKGKELAAA